MKGLKQYNEDLRTLLDDLEDWLNDLKKAHLLERKLFDPKNDITVNSKIAKIPTHLTTYQMFENGKTIPEIARERGLVNETVFGHLAKFAAQGVLDIGRIVATEKIAAFEKEFAGKPGHSSLTDWKNVLPKAFEFYEIRILLNHYTYLEDKKSNA